MPAYDTVFRGALVYDGTGAPPSRGDVAIAGERIAALDRGRRHCPWRRRRRGGRQQGSRSRPASSTPIPMTTASSRSPDMLPKISQGVTTVVIGNCGISLAPVDLRGAIRHRR